VSLFGVAQDIVPLGPGHKKRRQVAFVKPVPERAPLARLKIRSDESRLTRPRRADYRPALKLAQSAGELNLAGVILVEPDIAKP